MAHSQATPEIDLKTEISGAELRDFYQNHWPKDWYVEEFYTDFEDEHCNFTLLDSACVRLCDLGWAAWQGLSDAPDGSTRRTIGELYLETMFGPTNMITVSLRVPREKLEALQAYINEIGASEI